MNKQLMGIGCRMNKHELIQLTLKHIKHKSSNNDDGKHAEKKNKKFRNKSLTKVTFFLSGTKKQFQMHKFDGNAQMLFFFP